MNFSCSLRVPLFALVITSILLPSACTDIQLQKPRAFGREKEILVICDDGIWQKAEADLRKRIEVQLQAVRREAIFEIAHVEAADAQHYKEWDKIVLIESLENMKLLPRVVDDSTLKKIGQGQGLFFSQKDIWARGQRVAGLAARTDDQLLPLIKVHGNRIFNDFLRLLEEREKVRMYHSGKNLALADSLMDCCDFSIELPQVYDRIRQDSLPANGFLFVHQDPVRSIYLTWTENPPALDLSRKALAGMRETMLKKIYPNMITHIERVDTSTVSANEIERLRVYGTWEDPEEISGGVYISQIIESPLQNRRYYIDCLLFSPDARLNKYRFIFQLDNILNSFTLKGQL